MKKRSTYQHGHLPEALENAVMALVEERGVRGFTLAEAARRSGVSVSAPYRHYADRDALLAAVAAQAYGVLQQRLAGAKARHRSPVLQLCAMASAYVRFANDDRARFDLLFNSGIEKATYPDLERAADAAYQDFLTSVSAACGTRISKLTEVAVAIRACAHGYALLMLDGTLEHHGISKSTVPKLTSNAVRGLLSAFLADAP